ncbi:hypothetical protein WN55_09448 [Dufourea novaeangliae]|uniref:Uncharacterized protein n=1 Tax=Dufourea novaeangliae TaxID=178035 RepID=A0A154P689_DUFNO|nr:hypothetical protein WN55_09448 [Dufourea novaeangliae]
MFGTKLRTWMEAHIVRSKKKKDRKKGEKGFDSNCNSPRNQSANRSPGLHQVHPAESPGKTVDGIRLHGSGSYVSASASSGASAGTGSVNLSSPESAYSTGYSTDGTSPGTSYPPEYYINIRTGTHYFQSSGNIGERPGTEESREERSQRAHAHAHAQPDRYHTRTTTESFSADSSSSNLTVPSSIPPPLVSSSVQSPRERSRIRTNPWLSANSSGPCNAGFRSRLNLDDPNTGSGLKLGESYGSASDVNGTREGRASKEVKQESLSAGRSPLVPFPWIYDSRLIRLCRFTRPPKPVEGEARASFFQLYFVQNSRGSVGYQSQRGSSVGRLAIGRCFSLIST